MQQMIRINESKHQLRACNFVLALLVYLVLNLNLQPSSAQMVALPTLPNPIPLPIPQTPEAPFNPSLPSPAPLLNVPVIPLPGSQIPTGMKDTIKVQRFIFRGNIVFSDQELRKVTDPFIKRDITFAELIQAKAAITQLYIAHGYINSGAFIPKQDFLENSSVIILQIVERKVDTISVSGGNRLHRYVRSRLKRATSPIFNRDQLLEAMILLQADPLIKTISANLLPSGRRGHSVLEVQIETRQPISIQVALNNDRSPLIGSFERRVQLNNANLLGLGDDLALTYRNTVGSNAGEATYTVPFNARNGTIQLNYAIINTAIVEPPFDRLNISTASRSYEISIRQPLIRRATQQGTQEEFALGLTASRQESDERLLGIPFPLSPGADRRGRTRISALRFFQDYSKRSSQQLFFARSQFSLGVGVLNATINAGGPDSRFFFWQGQALYLRQLNRQNLSLLLKTNLQFATRPLDPFDQFSLGGETTIRGYRQDAILTDDGILVSAELQIPLLIAGNNVLRLIPFVDFGYGFNLRGSNPDPNTLAAVGVAIEYQLGTRLRVRLDYGIPLTYLPGARQTLQDQGLNLRLEYNLIGN